MTSFIDAFLIILSAFLMVFSLPHGSPIWAFEHEQSAPPKAESGQRADSASENTASGATSAGAGAVTGLKQVAISAIVAGVIVMGAVLVASVASDAGPIPTTSHHP